MIRRLTLLTLSAGITACGGESHPEVRPSEVPANTYTVEARPLTATMPVEGTAVARQRAEVTTRMMARITSMSVDVGSQVRNGQVLVRLGTDDIAANRTKAEAAVTAAQAARDEAAKHAARMDTLLSQDVVAQVQRDQAHLQLAQAQSQLQLAQATLREVETAASYATIRAPFNGVIVARYHDAGDVAAPGMPILVIESNGPRDAVLAVSPDVVEALEVGMTLQVRSGDGRAVDAPVRAIAGGADPWTRTVEVKAELPASWPTGVSVTALVPTGSMEGVAIPRSAVIR
ncbi:MAG: efflux RND transporter periplasmic adaptor subunit, partial [Gemmatimonadales bacterium]